MARLQVERETKLEAGVGFVLPSMEEVIPGVSAVPQPELRLQAVYVDTSDLRLMRAGLTLRHRQERDGTRSPVAEWTLKLPGDGGSGGRGKSDSGGGVAPSLVRREFTWPGTAQSLPPEASGMVAALRRSATLEPVARLVTQRRRTELRDQTGCRLAEIDDDVVSVMEGRRLAARFREIEVELADAATGELLGAVLARLQDAGAVRSDGRSKVVRALGPRAMEPPDVHHVELDGDATVAEVVRAAIADGFLRLVAHDPGVRVDEDPEAVHQARVATRRLRSDLRTFRQLLDPGWVEEARAELGWVASALGEVRDADVLMERLREHVATLTTDDSLTAAALLDRLLSERGQARERLMDVLNSERYLRLLDRLAQAGVAPPWAQPAEGGQVETAGADQGQAVAEDADGAPGPAAATVAGNSTAAAGHPKPRRSERRARKEAGSLVIRPWRHLARAVEALGDDPDDDALHQVRIRAKRLRYACEAVAPAQGSAAELGRAASRLQTVLGDLHDAIVAEIWLRRAAAEGSQGEAMVGGQLVTLERQAAAVGRRDWRAVWDEVDRKRLRAWLS